MGILHAWSEGHSLLYHMLRVFLSVDSTASKVVWFPGEQYLQLWPQRLATALAQAQPNQRGFALALEALAYLQVIARAYGTQVIVVSLPSKEEIYLPLLGEPVLDLGRAFREALVQRGLTVLDLVPVFRHWAAKGEALFFTTSRLPNPQGHAVIARSVSHHLAVSVQTYGLHPWEQEIPQGSRVTQEVSGPWTTAP